MTSTQNPRIAAAIRHFEQYQGGRYLAAWAEGDDVLVTYASGFNGSEMRYRVSGNDIDLRLASEVARLDVVERLKAHGLNAEPVGLNGDVVIRSSPIEALALANALDRLEGLS